MPMRRLWLAAVPISVAATEPLMPKEYTTVISSKMPYIGMVMPLRVLTSTKTQKIEYYDGLEVDVQSANGTWKNTFNNSRRVCEFKAPAAGPTLLGEAWQPLPFLPDLSQYTQAADELVGGIMCQKFVLDQSHGTTGTMDDHISFYWDPVLSKPVRWHMHARHVTFGSHTDEYIFDYLHFEAGAPPEEAFALPADCKKPVAAEVAVRAAGLLVSMHAVPARDALPSFEAFLKHHGKVYSEAEHVRRREIFDKNVKLIGELNQKHAGVAHFRGNEFLDMTRAEVMRLRGGKRRSSRAQRRATEHLKFVQSHTPSNVASSPPKDFDWRVAKPGVVGPVKDQGFCGSCWAYGAIEPIESILAVQTGQPLVTMPEQYVVDCTWTNNTGASAGNFGCDGGDSDVGVLEIVRKFGGIVPTAEAYGSYLGVNGYCKDTSLMAVGARVTGWTDIKDRDEQGLLEALVTQGPVNVNIQVPDEMVYYDSGVLKVEGCRNNATEIDHAVVLVGYGTDEHGTDYYTIRNSWSTYWGDEGYVKVARGDLDCCISCEAGYPRLQASKVRDNVVIV